MKKAIVFLSLALLVVSLVAIADWVYIPNTGQVGSKSIPDNSSTSLFSVTLPTANTGCSITIYYTYFVTDTVNTASHNGTVSWLVNNEAGIVTRAQTHTDFDNIGTGCAAGCDTFNSSVVVTTVTANTIFNNTLSRTGSLVWTVTYNTCPGYTAL